MPSHRFSQVDVFTDVLTEGNPVAVVHDADDLDDAGLAAFARWTNLSETTFLMEPTVEGADYRLRIFTTGGELPFAGHPTLGSARAWLEAGGVPARDGTVVQQCELGLVPVRTSPRLAFAAPPPLRSGAVDEADVKDVVTALGLSREDVVDAWWCDNGPGWVGLLMPDAAAVLAIDLDQARFGRLDKVGVVGPHPQGSDVDFEVRAFYPGGLGEDPVTGSLNAALAQWLIGSGRAPEVYVAAQGTRVQRRGRIHVERVGEDIWVGGDTVIGVAGTVAL